MKLTIKEIREVKLLRILARIRDIWLRPANDKAI